MKEVCRLSIVYEVDGDYLDDPKDRKNMVRHRIEFCDMVGKLFCKDLDTLDEICNEK